MGGAHHAQQVAHAGSWPDYGSGAAPARLHRSMLQSKDAHLGFTGERHAGDEGTRTNPRTHRLAKSETARWHGGSNRVKHCSDNSCRWRTLRSPCRDAAALHEDVCSKGREAAPWRAGRSVTGWRRARKPRECPAVPECLILPGLEHAPPRVMPARIMPACTGATSPAAGRRQSTRTRQSFEVWGSRADMTLQGHGRASEQTYPGGTTSTSARQC